LFGIHIVDKDGP